MAMFGIAEIMMMLLFGAMMPDDAEPLPPEQVLWGMPEDCEVMAFLDLRNAGPTMSGYITTLQSQAWAASSREIGEGLAELAEALDQAQLEANTQLGFDPFTQLTSVSFCMRLEVAAGSEPRPQMLAVVQGGFPQTSVGRFAEMIDMAPTPTPTGQSIYAHSEDGINFGLFSPQEGVAVFATDAYYTPLLAGLPAMAMPAPSDSASLLSRLAAIAPGGVQSYFALRPSVSTGFLIASEMPTSMAQLVQGMSSAVVASGAGATYFEVTASNQAAYDRFGLILTGVGALSQASPLVAEGMANLFFGILSPDDMEIESELRAILPHREELMATLEAWGFTAEVEVTQQADAAAMRQSLLLSNDSAMQGAGMMLLLIGMPAMMFSRASYDYEDYAPAYEAPSPTEVHPY